ncbi:MAG: glycoside hydrolase family 57 protein, partial [Deltaproteobacteria bacterium]|nr:glycoside hydrolase family 57 protein [Deltaproteobacteria bacterium]
MAFVWHMHQPLYKDPITNEYTLPWVLFHATKDYYDMAAILEEFPEVHQTFNVVPCLIEQIEEYGEGRAQDLYLSISKKPASELTGDDKVFMLRNFFQANWDLMIKPLQRYWELLMKRGPSNAREEVESVLRYFNDQDYLDLQVFFNLVWIDPHIRRNDKTLKALSEKGGRYTEEDKKKLFAKQIEIVNRIVPEYRKLMDSGIIEVSTTPYYHPIMPLLCDSFSAKEAMPEALLPKERFMHPEDAMAQLRKGISLYEKTFGRRPAGIWPSEGSVSMEMLPLVASEGVRWIATDEEILTNSLKRPLRRDDYGHTQDPFLYKPYAVDVLGKKVSIVFRDHVLSDLIGFDYAKMEPQAAANDMVERLEHIENMLERPGEHIVSIILDGENAWEHFSNDGRDFLTALYTRLSKHPKLQCVTVNEFLEGFGQREELQWLYPGSWINHNFKIWIGHVEDNTAWEYISEARGALVEYQSGLTPDE